MNTATEKQIGYINSLKERVEHTVEVQTALATARELWSLQAFDKQAASIVIETLKSAPTFEVRKVEDAPEGMHKFGGVIFKVQRSPESGRLYAKALVEDGQGGWRFDYTPGAIKNLSAETLLSLEEAKAFGALYGTCCVCGRMLTNENSIEAGIGPVCAGRF